MKNLAKITLLIFSVGFLTFCSDDEPEEMIEDVPNKLSDIMVITDASKVEGLPPTPNGNYDLELFSESIIAAENGSFKVEFETTDGFEGIYLQVVGADSYYDVPASSTEELRMILENDKRAFSSRLTEDEFGLSVGFSETPPATTFCYIICIYDDEGNISLPEEFCVTVANWGGNSSLVGKWRYIKGEEYEDGSLIDTEIEYTGEVVENQEIGYQHCSDTIIEIADFINDAWIELLSNGDYTDNYLQDIQSITPNCGQEDILDIYYGNWSYNAASNTITIVDFADRENALNFPNDPEYYESFPDGAVYINGTVESLDNNNLVIKEDETDDGYYYLIYFEKF